MNQKNYLILDNEFIKYCELNKIENPQEFAEQVFKKGFNIVKYGEVPFGFSSGEKIVEKEVIKEIIKEIPVDRIIEKPIEIIREDIKEVPVTLKVENEKLKSELESLTKSLEGLGRKGKFMKDSNLSSLYGE